MAIQATDPRNTFAAIATGSGVGAIAVVRISGPQAIVISEKGFRPPDVLGSSTSHTAHVGQFVDGSGVVIDEVVATVFRSPRSYTGEDVVELSCHGSSLIAHRILDTLVAFGARIAQPGEFTKRAFLNGKIDLAQAEAVAELIGARSEMARRASLDQLSGSMSKHNDYLTRFIEGGVVGFLVFLLPFVWMLGSALSTRFRARSTALQVEAAVFVSGCLALMVIMATNPVQSLFPLLPVAFAILEAQREETQRSKSEPTVSLSPIPQQP